jgi:TetR/AcrR family transcriptional regulator, regulator of biofilm formation and stress response
MRAPVNTKRENPRRREILEATLRLIGEGGVDSVTHRAVADEAGVSLASTTYYFDSKSALIEEALELMIARSTECVREHTTAPPKISQAELINRIVAFADAQINDPQAFLTAQYELMLEAGRSEYLRPLARRWTIAYMDGFRQLVVSAGLRRPKVAAEIIMKFVEGALLDQAMTPTDDFLDAYFRPHLTDLVRAWGRGNGRTKQS